MSMQFRPMRIRWGSYIHRVSEGQLRISRTPILNHSRIPFAFMETWSWTGKLIFCETSLSGVIRAMRDFERAYGTNGQDLVLETIDGVPSYHALRSRDCIGGTKVIEIPQYPNGTGAEALSYRSYTVAVQGKKLIGNGESVYTSFNETISIEGGGWKRGCKEVNYGPGIQQQLRTHTTCVATQSGSATLYAGSPVAPPPIWPAAQTDQYPRLASTSPETEADGRRTYVVNQNLEWSYNYAWPFRLWGTPHYLLK